MKTKYIRHLFSAAVAMIPFSGASGQTIIQHLGATDPVTAGFTLSSTGDVQLGPVFGDLGFDSWKIHSRITIESATYNYFLMPAEREAAMTDGWMMSANTRFVEASDAAFVIMSFATETRRFRLRISAIDNGELVVSGDAIHPFSFEGDALGYHEYALVYDPLLDEAALWIDGIVRVTGISGATVPSASPYFIFGASGEGITHSHWNEASFAIIPEPATVALLTGMVALLATGILRRRRANPVEE